MSKIVRIFAPKTYNKKKQPQLLLVSRTANSIRLHRSDGCLLTTPTTETWALAVAASMKGLPTWELAVTPKNPTHVFRFFSRLTAHYMCY